MVLRKLDNYTENNDIRLHLTPLTNLSAKWIKLLEIGTASIKVLEKNTSRTF